MLRIWEFAKRHAFLLCIIAVLLCWTIRLVQLNYTNTRFDLNAQLGFSSDDVAQQNILWAWTHGYHSQASIGDDSWYLKFPLYVLVNFLPIAGSYRLFATSWILMAATALLLFFGLRRFLLLQNYSANLRMRMLLVGTFFLTMLPSEVLTVFKMPNSRNIEIGLYFFLLVQLFWFLRRPKTFAKRPRIKLTVLALLSGAVIAEDPLLLYIAAVPILVVVLWRLLFAKGKQNILVHLKVLGFMVISIFISIILKKLIAWTFPLQYLVHAGKFVDFDTFLNNLRLLFTVGPHLFGIRLWDNPNVNVTAFVTALYASALILGGIGIYRAIKKQRPALFYIILGSSAVWTLLLFVTTTASGTGDGSSRYLITLFVFEWLGLMVISTSLGRRQLTALFALLICGSCLIMGSSLASMRHRQHYDANSQAIIQTLRQRGFTKGYASYWAAGITTYFSNEQIQIINTSCSHSPSHQKLYYLDVLSERAVRDNLHADKSFYVYSPKDAATCDPGKLIRQLGAPTSVANVAPYVYIAFYGHDIGPGLPTTH